MRQAGVPSADRELIRPLKSSADIVRRVVHLVEVTVAEDEVIAMKDCAQVG